MTILLFSESVVIIVPLGRRSIPGRGERGRGGGGEGEGRGGRGEERGRGRGGEERGEGRGERRGG